MERTAGLSKRGAISVIIPVYNHEKFVREAVESALNQDRRPAEIIVIDDGSTDRSARVVEQCAEKHPEISFRSRPNMGAHHTINEGIRAASGEFLSILNSDDVYDRRRFAACMSVIQNDPGTDAVVTGISFIDGRGKQAENPWYEQARSYYNEVGDMGLALLNGNFIMTTSNLFVRRSVFEELGGFDNLRYAHDLDFFLRMVAAGKKFRVLDSSLLQYRMHGNNTISEDHSRVRVEWAAAAAVFAHAMARGGDWVYMDRLADIADRHNLTRMMLFLLLHMQNLPGGEKQCSSLLADPGFKNFIHEKAK